MAQLFPYHQGIQQCWKHTAPSTAGLAQMAALHMLYTEVLEKMCSWVGC